ncbi:MAG: hypothetical protein WCA19_14965 [Candidatus Acidiferrales bacterium]
MAVEGIGSLVQILADQLSGQPGNLPAGANVPASGNAANPAVTEDTFTPSGQSNSAQTAAQDAGIFQVSQGALSAVAANILFEQATSNGVPNGSPAQTAQGTTTNAGNPQPGLATNSNAPQNPGQLFAPDPAGQPPAPKAVPTTNVQEKILILNASLPALGLSKVEIQEIDNIATQIQNFNPAAYAALVNQFEALAQQATQQNAANANNPATQNTTPGTKVNGGGSQG